ncbi:MAG: hypothetical protein AVDCRST_MAG96-3405 [uncultured Segetibacter sp.]|uniref:Uncharacterized protein n=1 Tax=uncultured Segetibacter sp. TaxID=481133 RepID=A0A6J4TRR3_9BACT|nr:MAG: hypothetical protein AVDCRST_MAG96-3405 [uncultured Segetibacter sp.]
MELFSNSFLSTPLCASPPYTSVVLQLLPLRGKIQDFFGCTVFFG